MELNMYSKRLDVFITLAQYLNFSETANHLYMTQSAVSHSISDLEKELGVTLFERTQKGCKLTSSGRAFLSEAYRIISLSESAKARIGKLSRGECGEITIGFATELMVDPLVECFRGFARKYPDIDLNFMEYDSVSVARMLVDDEIDMAFGRRDALFHRDDLLWRHIYRDPLQVLLPNGHRLEHEKSITLEQLLDETIIIVGREINPGFFDVISKLFLSKGITPIFNTICNERMAAVFKVRIGKGITILTEQFVKVHWFDDLSIVPLDADNAWLDRGVAWKKDSANPAVKLLLKAFDDYLAE